MESKIINVIEEPKGTYSCEIGLTVEEWQKLLADPDFVTENIKDTLLAFYNEPDHKSTCKLLSQKYYGNDQNVQRYNSGITRLGENVVLKTNRFHIYDKEGKERYWHVAINPGKRLSNGLFEWQLRKEVVEAIENLGWNQRCTWIPFYMEMADKLLEYKDDRNALLNIVYELDSKYNSYIRDEEGGRVSDIDPFTVIGLFNRGLTNQNRLKVADYLKKRLSIDASLPTDFDGIPVLNNQKGTFFYRSKISTDIQSLWDLFEAVLKEDKDRIEKKFDEVRQHDGIRWNITMGLFWIRPNDYISLDKRNRDYLPTIGINVFDDKDLDYAHYNDVLTEVKYKIQNNLIKEESIADISINAWKNDQKPTIWLVGYSFGSNNSQYERFINDKIWEGCFDIDKVLDKSMYNLAKNIKIGDIIILKSTSTKGKNHDQPFMRIKAVGVVSGEMRIDKPDQYTICKCGVNYLSTNTIDFDGREYGAYRKTIHQMDGKIPAVVDYVNSIVNNEIEADMPKTETTTSKYQVYIDLLKEAKNLVLTGAPGTGKTFMAQAIAEEMGAEMKFVQFHPSYDYTDFVEGLRPIDNGDGQMGFERKDGVFKEFCKEALRNVVDSEKSVENLTKELSWQDKLDQFVDDALETGKKFKTVNGSEFSIVARKGHTIVVHNEQNEKTTDVAVSADEILDLLNQEVRLNIVRDIRNHYGRKFGTQPDSYVFVIVKEVRKMKDAVVTTVDKVNKKPYIMIIDEINRGEASKIFGELFYAIDPGYRGKTDVLVQTQYQNLVPESDVFAKGFYVPENVYILATMNDIDRSVESMDFAMRRRFTWMEVAPTDTENMLDVLGEPLAAEAKTRMHNLNKAIAETEGLGEAYMIGPSYFLKLNDNGGDFSKLWKMNIEPLLKEYLRGFRKAKDSLEKFENAYSNVVENVGKDTPDVMDDED